MNDCLNVVLDIAFIGVFHTGVGGAALATIISQFLSGLLCLRRLLRTDAEYRVDLRKIRFHSHMIQQTDVILATRIHGPVQYLHFLQCVLFDSQFVCHALF